MDLYEFQGRALFERHGLPLPPGGVATTAAQARVLADRLGGRVVVKAQVKTGGRGKAGGVRVADHPAQVASHAADILGMEIKGHPVRSVLLTAAVDLAAEYYLAYLLDRAHRTFRCIASVAGGMDIEQVAAQTPERVAQIPVPAGTGVDDATAREIVAAARFPAEVAEQVAGIAVRLWQVFVAEDATLVEVNPLARTTAGELMLLDAKVTLDDNARFRHPDHETMTDRSAVDPLEQAAREAGLNYVKLDGSVGVIGNGAGLVMSTLDVVSHAGAEFGGIRPANFLDIGGGASATMMADGLRIVLADHAVTSVFINIFGGITACDEVATGILQALQLLTEGGGQLAKPLVVRLDGNNAATGRAILDAVDIPLVEQVDTMDEAARRAAELAAAVRT